jgi:hypothetical protein
MDFKLVSGVLGVLCIVLAALAVMGGGGVKTVYVNNTVYPVSDLSVQYLYPLRCVNCDLNVPGQCDYCNSYYDERTMDLISQDMGVPVKFFISDAILRPGLLVSYKDKVTLGDGRTRFNIASTLCDFAKAKASCDFFNGYLSRSIECVKGFGVAADTMVYQTASKSCPLCSKTDAVVEGLRGQDYSDGVKYKVFTADRSGLSAGIISNCMQAFDGDNYAPQLICPKTGKDLTGDFTLSQAREFADKCIETK